jgi:hypothetical protein
MRHMLFAAFSVAGVVALAGASSLVACTSAPRPSALETCSAGDPACGGAPGGRAPTTPPPADPFEKGKAPTRIPPEETPKKGTGTTDPTGTGTADAGAPTTPDAAAMLSDAGSDVNSSTPSDAATFDDAGTPASPRTGACASSKTALACDDCCNTTFKNTPDLWEQTYDVYRHNLCDSMFDPTNPDAFTTCMEMARNGAADAAQAACDADTKCKGALNCFNNEAHCASLPVE